MDQGWGAQVLVEKVYEAGVRRLICVLICVLICDDIMSALLMGSGWHVGKVSHAPWQEVRKLSGHAYSASRVLRDDGVNGRR